MAEDIANYIDPKIELMQHQAVMAMAAPLFLKFMEDVGPGVALSLCALVLAEHQFQLDNPQDFPIDEEARVSFARNTDLSIQLALLQAEKMKNWIKESPERARSFAVSIPAYPQELALMQEQLRVASEGKKVEENALKGLDNTDETKVS